jgi:Sec7-like guanine-nucleotide exchange factor
LYDKTNRPPIAGSLQESLFLHVWLKREEAKLSMAQMLSIGLRQLTNANGVESAIPAIFRQYVEALFPFYTEIRTNQDQKMVDVMKKEVEKGMISFNPIQTNLFKNRAKEMSLPDDFKRKLRKKKG